MCNICNMRYLKLCLMTLLPYFAISQSSISGKLVKESDNSVVDFAYVALYQASDSTMIKVETANEFGEFKINDLSAGDYFLKATYIGLPDLKKDVFSLKANEALSLGVLKFKSAAVEMNEFNITAERAIVSVEPDKTIFNVEGTINSTGSDAIELLRKAPSVTVDNNDNINVLGRSGVLLYIDGKQLPLAGDDLSNYLKKIGRAHV